MTASDRVPVIIGVGQVEDRQAADRAPFSALDLMQQAILAAARDAGAENLLPRVGWIGVVNALTWDKRPDPIHPYLIERLRLSPAHAETSMTQSGTYPVRYLNEAANLIAAGEHDLAVIVGGECMRSMTRAARAGGAPSSGTEMIRTYRNAGETDLARRYSLLTPVDIYPLYEQATRHAWGQSQAEATAETASIWEANARVAAANPHAWLRAGWSGQRITTPAADNPMLTYPYTKSMVANSSVNQGAAILLASAACARAFGIAESRFVSVGYGAGADESPHNLMRANFSASPAMAASLTTTLELNGITDGELDLVELYSCFPCIPKMARRVIGWPVSRPSSVYGGLTFGGGPIGNCMSHAVAAMTIALRNGAQAGLIFANGGFATGNHSIVLRRGLQCAREPLSYDAQALADRLRGPIPPMLEGYEGPAQLETFTAPYADGRPRYANVLALTPSGSRCLCRVPGTDAPTLAWLTGGNDVVGTLGRVETGDDGFSVWRAAA
jgi:acetyl-CoA C-acetyltransferase